MIFRSKSGHPTHTGRMLISAFCLTGAAITACNEKAPQKPNIIFIYGDDIGYGDLECYGARAVRTPAVYRLASSGLRFTNAYACAGTSTPSRYGLLTG